MFSELIDKTRITLGEFTEKFGSDVENVLTQIPDDLRDNKDYLDHVILPALTFMFTFTKELTLPDINKDLTKENAIPRFMWGLLWEDWKKSENDGTSIFLQGYAFRGENNRKKKAYFSAVTPELYRDQYAEKVGSFFSEILSDKNSDKPFMSIYLAEYLNLYWNLHLNVTPEEIPDFAKDIGSSFMTCLALVQPFYLDDLQKTRDYKSNYLNIRNTRGKLDAWLGGHYDNIKSNPSDYKNTFVHYWIANSGDGEGGFEKKDISFECFHNFVALSQWGNVIYNMMHLLREDNNDEQARQIQQSYVDLMSGDYNAKATESDMNSFTKLDFFTFELMRVIMPNSGSISRVELSQVGLGKKADETNVHDHVAIGNSPLHWADAVEVTEGEATSWVAPFNPDRYKTVPGSNEIDEESLKKVGALARCPFDHSSVTTKDGRTIENNAFGTTHSSNADESFPVIESAGYSPFGFGYRRCPGELFTISVFKDFLVTVWDEKIGFRKLDLEKPTQVPVAPELFVTDDVGFFKKK